MLKIGRPCWIATTRRVVKLPPSAGPLDFVQDRHLGIAGQDEIGVQGVAQPLLDRALRRDQRLAQHLAAEDALRAVLGTDRRERYSPRWLEVRRSRTSCRAALMGDPSGVKRISAASCRRVCLKSKPKLATSPYPPARVGCPAATRKTRVHMKARIPTRSREGLRSCTSQKNLSSRRKEDGDLDRRRTAQGRVRLLARHRLRMVRFLPLRFAGAVLLGAVLPAGAMTRSPSWRAWRRSARASACGPSAPSCSAISAT